ncbi:MAG: ACT domain-containing protein [Myxococcota bacterium]
MGPTPEKNLQQLLRTMQPSLLEGVYAFVTVANGKPTPPGLSPLMTYREPEGLTLLLDEKDLAKSGLPHAFFCRGISLNVNSSLYAVGFLAAVSERLARAAMSINIVSAFHRDYIFVPSARAEEALEVLRALAHEARGGAPRSPADLPRGKDAGKGRLGP